MTEPLLGNVSGILTQKKDGTTIKCQGTWELAFAKWLDENNIEFVCHKGRIPYMDNKKEKSYYPDFWIEPWDSYVDVKAKYFLDLQKNKFNLIRKSNPKKNFKILLKEDLLKLGVDLNQSSN